MLILTWRVKLIVVGDQSSGKSSVLESLTDFSFPRAAGLCTRYATQITCRREQQVYTDISIIPGPSASASEQERMRAFHRRVEGSNKLDLAQIFEDVSVAENPNGDGCSLTICVGKPRDGYSTSGCRLHGYDNLGVQ